MSVCKHGVNSKEATCGNCTNEQHRKASLRTRKLIAGLTRLLAPALGHWTLAGCLSCGIHDAVTPKHNLQHNSHTGSHLLCEGCWIDLSIEDKLRYYKTMYTLGLWTEKNTPWREVEMAIRYPYYWLNTSDEFLTIEEA